MAREDTQFKPGNPGRPKGVFCGRERALRTFDAVLNEVRSQKALKATFRAAIQGKELSASERRSLACWVKIIVPLMPKDLTVRLDAGGFPAAKAFASWVNEAMVEADAKAGNGVHKDGDTEGEAPSES